MYGAYLCGVRVRAREWAGEGGGAGQRETH